MVLEERMRLAGRVLETLDGHDPATVRLLARTLALAGWPVAMLGPPFDSWADRLEHPDVDGSLATLGLAYALRKIAAVREGEELLERLERVDEPPWPALREALVVVRRRPAA